MNLNESKALFYVTSIGKGNFYFFQLVNKAITSARTGNSRSSLKLETIYNYFSKGFNTRWKYSILAQTLVRLRYPVRKG